MSYDKSTQGAIKEVQHAFIEDRLSQPLISVQACHAWILKIEINLTMHDILEGSKYEHAPANLEHPMPLYLNDQLRLVEEEAGGKSLKMAHATGGLTKQAIDDLKMPNETTEKKYNHYVQDYYNSIHNEKEQHGPTDKRTLVIFSAISKIKNCLLIYHVVPL